MKINRISPDAHLFLQRTENIAKKPESLYFIGELPAEPVSTVGIIGTRHPTTYGREITERISRELAARGIIIISGLALGIDAIAHASALEAGGKTVAVLPCGVDDPQPRTNQNLARRILQQKGVLLSEYPPGTPTVQYRLLERNRLVAALSDVLIVTEASIKSGTMSTVSHALEQGKTVFAVPGNITSPLSAGCNHLIKQGASILIDPSDVLEELGIKVSNQTSLPFGDNTEESVVLGLLQAGIQDGDTLLLLSKLSSSSYNQVMTMLEIKGVITPLGANNWSLRH